MDHSVLEFASSDIALACALLASVTDVKSRRIPNLLTGPAMLAGLSLHLAIGGWSGFANSFGALLLCGAAFMLIHLAGGMGAGDVKLIAAQGSLLGLSDVPALLAFTAICGGVAALVLAAKHGRLRATVLNAGTILAHHSRQGLVPHPELNVKNSTSLRLPYAIAIAGGTFLTVLSHTALVPSW